jgi:hypothetical protein
MGMDTVTKLDEVILMSTCTWELLWYLHYNEEITSCVSTMAKTLDQLLHILLREHRNGVDEARYMATMSTMRMFGVNRF